jgi:hypothetical protein
MLGEKAAQGYTALGSEWKPGDYKDRFGELRVTFDPINSQEVTNTVARHELAHALDHVLGQQGKYLSSEPEFRAIYDETRAATDSGKGAPAFPTDYAATDPQELFAESAAIFLGTHTLREQGNVETVTTREDLRRTNPKLYSFMEKVFAERVPEALRQNRIQGRETIPANQLLQSLIDELEAIPEGKRTGPEWMNLGRYKAMRGGSTGDRGLLEEALRDTKTAKRKARILGVPIPVISGRLSGQIKQIEANLQSLPEVPS